MSKANRDKGGRRKAMDRCGRQERASIGFVLYSFGCYAPGYCPGIAQDLPEVHLTHLSDLLFVSKATRHVACDLLRRTKPLVSTPSSM